MPEPASLGGGGFCSQGVSAPRGGICSRGVCSGGCLLGGCLLWGEGVAALGVSAPGGVSAWGVCSGEGGSAPRGCLVSQHAKRQTPPRGQNHRRL